MKIKGVFLVFLIIFSAAARIGAATDEGYGEDQTSLGQFVDSFETSGNVSVAVNVIRNSTLEVMELNYTEDGGYGNFTNYIEFDVDYNRVNSNLTTFPILLEISDSAGITGENITAIFDEIGNSYLKIAVTDISMLSEYYIEVERWDSTAKIGILWISPDVSSLENTTLRLHFGAEVANNTLFVGLPGSVVASNVWDAGFASVWHMGTGTGDEVDSTGNGNLATEVGTVLQAAGQIGFAREFLGSDDHFHFTDADLGIGAGQFTYEAWFNQYGGGYGRIIYTYDPTSGIYISTGGQLGGSFDVYGIIFVSGASTNINSAPGRSYNDGTWYYITYTRDGSNDLELAVDAIQVATGNRGGSIDGGGHGHIGNDISHTVEFEGYIDEVRVSTTFRSTDWRNASYLSGIDNLVFWRSTIIEVGAGYVNSGYFTTTDYLSDPLANGSALVYLTNTTMPANTAITLEFSEDNSTWIFNDWQPIFGGFESVDLRDLDYSAGLYIRHNLSTTDPNETPRVYQSRLITTIGNVSAPEIVNVTGSWIEYNASAIGATVGTVDDGDLESTYLIDGDMFNVSEVVGVPGMIISINFTGVDPAAESLWVLFYGLYDGNLNHDFDIEVWNFETSAWIEDTHIPDMVAFDWINSTIYPIRIPNEFLRNGEVRIRLDHEAAGNINHDLFIDYVRLQAFIPSAAGAAVETFQLFWIAIAIALMLLAIMLSKMWFDKGDP